MLSILRNTLSLTRNERIRFYARYTKKRTIGNPGMDHKLKILKEEGIDTSPDDLDDLVNFEDYEPDFSKLNISDREHEKETYKHKEFVQRKIVERKYFKEYMPNLLTWSEKEQIRYLHSHDPDQWDVKRICQSFPVTEDAAKKLIKAVWKPATERRIYRHDASALRNWRELKEGTLEDITSEMREHFLKFANRAIPPRLEKDVEETKQLSLNDNLTGEYVDIIKSYKKAVENTYNNMRQNDDTKIEKRVDVYSSENKQNEMTTLNALRKSISTKIDDYENVPIIDQYIVSSKNLSYTKASRDSDFSAKTYEIDDNSDKQLLTSNPGEDSDVAPSYPLKIKIPRDVWKKGGTYKVKDCYYDYDGEFLYRVPGMHF